MAKCLVTEHFSYIGSYVCEEDSFLWSAACGVKVKNAD